METKELIEMVKRLGEIRNEKDKQKKVIAEIQAREDKLEYDLLAILESEGLKTFATPYGKITSVEKTSFTTPKTIEDKLKLIETLKSIGGDETFHTYLTFNSNSINTWANGIIAAREEAGDFNCEIPGLGTPKKYSNLSFTGGKVK